MATKTEEFLSGNGTTLPFQTQYINETDIKVRVNGGSPLVFTTGTPSTGQYNIPNNGTTITFGDSYGGSDVIHVYSETNISNPTVSFNPGSSIKAADLNALETLVRHGIKESRNEIVTHDIRDAQVTSDKIKDGTIVDADISGSAAIAQSKIATGNLPSGITVNSANIVDGSIVNDDVSNSANIDGSKLANDTVGLTKLGSGALPTDITVASANIVDGTIVNADLNASAAIAGTKVTPSFGSQNIVTTGTSSTGQANVTGNIVVSGLVDGRDIALDGTKLDGIEVGATGDQTNAEIKTAYEANSNTNEFSDAEQLKLAGIENNAKDDQTAAEIKTLLQSNKLTDSEITAGTLDNRYYTETELNNGQLDNRYYTETEAEGLFLRQDSSENITSGVTWSSTDAKVATTAAIDARIIDLLDDVGGFVPLANETSFPAANPDINNGNGTVVSVKAVSTNLTPSSGTVTIANGAGTGNTVTITGVTGVIPSGFGMILETTSTLHTYAFHRLQAKATEVNTVATNITNVINCGQNLADIENFADLYQISTTAPTTRADNTALTIGDLWFDSSANQVMMVYDGSAGDGFSPITPNQSTITNINTVAGHVTFQEDLGLITNAVNTGSGNNSINTVGASIANVNTTATNIAKIQTVADDLNEGTSEIDTVATNIANVNTVGTNIANVNTVGGISANVTTVAGNNANVTTVAGKATEIGRLGTADAVADMNTLGTTAIVSDLDTLADISSNITTVAGISSNVTTVAGISGNVTTVAGNNSNVTAVAGNNSNITAVANNATNINAVQSNASNINTVAGINSDVTAVAGNNTNITAVKNNATNINAVQANASNINAAVSNASNINSAVSNATNINTVATNITDVNTFANVYRIDSSQPTTHLTEGDLYFDTTQDELRIYNGSSWQGGVTATGNLVLKTGATMTGNLAFSGTQTVDGRDVSVDGAKLDGIESGATADQSNSEIKTAYEANSNTNAFTDTLLSKLNAIEAGATGDQTVAEIIAAIAGQTIAPNVITTTNLTLDFGAMA